MGIITEIMVLCTWISIPGGSLMNSITPGFDSFPHYSAAQSETTQAPEKHSALPDDGPILPDDRSALPDGPRDDVRAGRKEKDRHEKNGKNKEKPAADYQQAPPEEIPERSPSGNKITKITLINTNDLHAYLPNMPEVAGIIDDLKKQHPDAILVDGGDIAYNPPISDKHYFEPMPEIMNAMGYQVASLGNHEFQWSNKKLEDDVISKVTSDVICGNALDKETGSYLPGVSPYVIKEVNGIKIGFIGLVTTKMATSAHPNVGKEVKKLDEAETLKNLIPEVKAKGAEIIVVISHQGIDDDPEMAKAVPGADVILAAHDHQLTSNPIVVGNYPHKTYIVESGSHGKYVGETTLGIDEKTHELVALTMRAIPTKNNTIAPNQEVKKIVDDFMKSKSLDAIPEYSAQVLLDLYDYIVTENGKKQDP